MTRPLIEMSAAANRLGITLSTAYYMARRGVIPAVKMGRLWRVDPVRLERWIEEGGSARNMESFQ